MRPQVLDRYFAAFAVFVFAQRPQLHFGPEAVRNIGVQFSRHFPVAPLRLDDDCQGDPLAACIRGRDSVLLNSLQILRLQFGVHCYSMISSAYRLSSFDPAALSTLRKARATRPERPIILP